MDDPVNERSTSILSVSFFDEDDVAVVPASATYRIDDVQSGTAILAATVIGVLAVSVNLHITEEQNRILTESHPYESRRVTVSFRYGAGSAKRGTDEYIYRIKNLYGITTAASASASSSASAS